MIRQKAADLFSDHRLVGAAAFLFAFIVFLYVFDRYFSGGVSYEFCHYAEIGRNIAQGKGFRTGIAFPATLALLERKGIPFTLFTPEMIRFPVYAYLVGSSQSLFGVGEFQVAIVNGAVLSLLAAMTMKWAGRFLSLPAALAAAGFLFFSPSILRGYALWGYPDILFALMIFLFTTRFSEVAGQISSNSEGANQFLSPSPSPSPLEGEGRARGRAPAFGIFQGLQARFFALGLLSGATWMARTNLIIWMPLFLFLLARSTRANGVVSWARCREPGIFVLGFFGGAAPYFGYLLAHFHGIPNGGFLWNLLAGLDGWQLPWNHYRVFGWGDLAEYWPSLLAKGWSGLLGFIAGLPGMWQFGPLLPLVGVGIYSRRKEAWGRWLLLNGLMLTSQLAVFIFFRQEATGSHVQGRYYLWLAPVLAVAAAAGIEEAARRIPNRAWRRVMWTMVLVAVGFYWRGFYGLADPGFRHPFGPAPRRWPEIGIISQSPNALVVTNIPAQVGLYAGARAVGLPYNPEDLRLIDRSFGMDFLLLTNLPFGEFGQYRYWQDILAPGPAQNAFIREFKFRLKAAWPHAVLFEKIHSSAP